MRFKKDQDVDSGVFEYHVSFNPPVDNVRDKKAIIRQQEHVLGRILGTNRYSPGYHNYSQPDIKSSIRTHIELMYNKNSFLFLKFTKLENLRNIFILTNHPV